MKQINSNDSFGKNVDYIKVINYVFISVWLALLTSCATVEGDSSKLNLGMSRKAVQSSLGNPGSHSYRAAGEEVWVYYYNQFGKVYAGAISTRSCLSVVFNGNRLASWQQACPGAITSIYHEQNDKIMVGIEQSQWLVSFPSRNLKAETSAGTARPGFFVWTYGPYVLSIIIEPASGCTSANYCRDKSLATIKKADVESYGYKTWEKDDFAFSEFLSKRGGKNQMHFNKHAVRDGYWYDIHLSKGDPNDEDEKVAFDYLENIRLVQK